MYVNDITLQKPYVPFHHNGGVGRCAQANSGVGHSHWPKEGDKFLLHMLKIAGSNAEFKGLDVHSLIIENIQVNKVPKLWH